MKSKEALLAEIEGVLAIVRQGLAMHGGNVEVTDVDPVTGKVFVRLQGSCVGCPMSELTLKAGIEDTLVSMIPEVTEVINIDGSPDEEDGCCSPTNSAETTESSMAK
jgi:Fe-S cluster biogenesis protein NfuA